MSSMLHFDLPQQEYLDLDGTERITVFAPNRTSGDRSAYVTLEDALSWMEDEIEVDAGDLVGTTLAAGVVHSSLTSIGTLTALSKTHTPVTIVPASGQTANLLAAGGAVITPAGDFSRPHGSSSERFGIGSAAAGSSATALGNAASAAGNQSVAIGTGSSAANTRSTAIGEGTASTANNAVSIGWAASCASLAGTAIGNGAACVSGDGAIAIGGSASATGAGCVVIGYQSTASGANLVAIGRGHSSISGGMALGYRVNNIALGEVGIGARTNASAGGMLVKLFANIASANEHPAGTIGVSWPVTTEASREGQIEIGAYYVTTNRVGVAIRANSSTVLVGFFGATPAARAAAYTQTYSSTTRTFPSYTPDDESSSYSGAAGDGEAQLDDLNALREAYENLRAHAEATSQVLNQVIDDLQTLGLLQ